MGKMIRMWKDFLYGVCYYPEHWPERCHARDIERIAAAGFNLIRMGEGAWSYWEPREGEYQFELFDRVIDLCRRYGIKVIMGTPTYCAPAWASTNYPQILRWDFNRNPMAHGSRRNLNYTAPKYLELSDHICAALAEHYRDEKQIIGWQLDNEFNCHMDVSYAPSDTVAFRQWLMERYRTLARLNAAWGTAFWSQTYTGWDQIDLPHPTSAPMNPHQLMDESRFISDCVAQFAHRQADILRRFNKRWLITHNGLFGNIDGPELAETLDFFSHDQYPLFAGETDWHWPAWGLIQARSLSQPFAVLEQQAGPGGQMSYLLRTPRPGQIRLWAWQSIVHGAKMVSYFRWRTCPYGSEQHWHGLLDPDNRDNRRIAEAKQLGREIKQLPKDFFDAKPIRCAAILRDFDNEVNERRINTYAKEGNHESSRWLAELCARHIPADMTWPDDDWTDYRLLIAPHLKMINSAIADKLTRYVQQGGTLILCAQSGCKERNGHLVQLPLPGRLRKLCGIEIEDWTTLPEKQSRTARLVDGGLIELNVFIERIKPLGAQPIAHWSGEDALLESAPAITTHRVGKGAVLYIGGYCPDQAVGKLLYLLASGMADPAPITPLASASSEVEILARTSGRKRFLCLLNHSAAPQSITGLPNGRELLIGRPVKQGELVLEGYAVAIVQW
ncbi:MAG: beta-galactosidase [Phycisphaerales bacterium]|jgi:beta-galactosidase|nr:beta-galactosidase [Phycisphaerales bacterium]